jgi:hypothetical protein
MTNNEPPAKLDHHELGTSQRHALRVVQCSESTQMEICDSGVFVVEICVDEAIDEGD